MIRSKRQFSISPILRTAAAGLLFFALAPWSVHAAPYAYVTNSARVIEIDCATGDRRTVSDYALGAGPVFVSPFGLCLGPNGVLLVADNGANAILAVQIGSGNRTLVSGGGRGAGLPLSGPQGAALDSLGAIIVTEPGASRVTRVSRATGDRTKVWEGPPLQTPSDVALDTATGGYLVVDSGARALFLLDAPTGIPSVVSGGSIGSGPAFSAPRGLTVETSTTILISDSTSDTEAQFIVYRVNRNTGERTVLSSVSQGTGASPGPNILGLAMLGAGSAMLTDPTASAAFGTAAVYQVSLATGNRSVLSGAAQGTGPALGFGPVSGPRFIAYSETAPMVSRAQRGWALYD